MEKCKGKSADKIANLVKAHLSEVKNCNDIMEYHCADMKLKDTKGMFKNREYSHIFHQDLSTNVIDESNKVQKKIIEYAYLKGYRDKIIKYIVYNNINLHIYSSHFNSSQTVVLNFLGPIIGTDYEKDFSKEVFGYPEGQFAIEVAMSDKGMYSKRGSEIDFTIKSQGILHLFEAKYTEQGFGKASVSKNSYEHDVAKYRDKWFGSDLTKTINVNKVCVQYNRLEQEEIIKEIPSGLCKNEHKMLTNKETFVYHYQLIRNLYNTFFEVLKDNIQLRKEAGNMHVVTLKDNTTHCHIVERFEKLLQPKYKKHLVLLDWQTLCKKAIAFAEKKDKDLWEHYTLFKRVFLDYE